MKPVGSDILFYCLLRQKKKHKKTQQKTDTLPKKNSNVREYFNTISSFRKRNFKNEKIRGSKNGHYRTCRLLMLKASIHVNKKQKI